MSSMYNNEPQQHEQQHISQISDISSINIQLNNINHRINHNNYREVPPLNNNMVSSKKSKQKENESKHINAIKPYVSNTKERKISKRQSQKNIVSPAVNHNGNYPHHINSSNVNVNVKQMPSKSKHKPSTKKLEQSLSSQAVNSSKNITDLYSQLVTIKAEYKTLKNSYNGLIKQNNDLTERGQMQAANVGQLKRHIQVYKRQEERYKNNIRFMEQQMERVKKQYVRMIEMEKFKNKKLQQTLQQKELMIAYLRAQLSVLNGQSSQGNGFFFQHTVPTYIKNSGQKHETSSNLIPPQKDTQKESSNRTNLLSYNQNPYQNLSQKNLIKEQEQMEHNGENRGSMQNNFRHPTRNYTNINKSIINKSVNVSNFVSSSIKQQSMDLPLQIKFQGVKNMHSKGKVNLHDIPNYENNSNLANNNNKPTNLINKNRRQYIFSNEDDSLSFSYQKSKQSIADNGQHNSSMQSNPSMLTFTKKDVYIIDEQHSCRHQPTKEHQCLNQEGIFNVDLLSAKEADFASSHTQQNQLLTNKEQHQYTGQQEILTFENRYNQHNKTQQSLFKILNPHLKDNRSKKDSKEHTKNKAKQQKLKRDKNLQHDPQYKKIYLDQQKKDGASKSKLHTKRLQICTDQVQGIISEGKELSAQNRKRPATQNVNTSKTGKKRMSRKRRSQQPGGSILEK